MVLEIQTEFHYQVLRCLWNICSKAAVVFVFITVLWAYSLSGSQYFIFMFQVLCSEAQISWCGASIISPTCSRLDKTMLAVLSHCFPPLLSLKCLLFTICAGWLWWQPKAMHILFLFTFKQERALCARCSGSAVRLRKPPFVSSASGLFFTVKTLS